VRRGICCSMKLMCGNTHNFVDKIVLAVRRNARKTGKWEVWYKGRGDLYLREEGDD